MKERPIIMTAESVRAILDGKKTQTRRVVKPQPDGDHVEQWIDLFEPPYKPGDRLWVREAWCIRVSVEKAWCSYKADFPEHTLAEMAQRCRNFGKGTGWKSPMLMPRRLSRITLEVTGLQCERLQRISAADAIAEGYESIGCYVDDWDKLNAKRGYGWDANPWVWVVEFKVINKGE